MSETGHSLGTPHYMSAEQATAQKEITARSDQYSLASVLYEMLSGQPPHIGGAAQAVIMKIITENAEPVTKYRRAVAPNVAAAVTKALEKLPADRFDSAKAFGDALADARFVTAGLSAPSTGSGSRLDRTTILVGAAVLVAAAALGWVARGWASGDEEPQPLRFATTLGRRGNYSPLIALSPDGRRIAQVADDTTGTPVVQVRDLGTNTVTAIAGTEGAWDGVDFSPDGEWLAFVATGVLKKVPTRGGPVTTWFNGMNVESNGVAWRSNGDVVLSVRDSGLFLLPAGGGSPRRLTKLDTGRKEFAHWAPQWLPGERVAIYCNYATPVTQARVEAVDVETGKITVLAEGVVYGRYAKSGHLFYARDAAMYAVAFDAGSLATTGTPVPVQDDVAWSATDGRAAFAVSPNGTMAYVRESEWNADYELVWRDRSGRDATVIATPGTYTEPRLSPDGRWIALTVNKPKRDLWLYDVGRRVLTQLTRAPAYAFNALWLTDSRRLVYSFEDRVYELHTIPIDASAPDRSLLSSAGDKYPSSVSPDGKQILMTTTIGVERLAIAPADGSAPPKRIDPSDAPQRAPSFSPDGTWIAYADYGNPRGDVYIRTLDGSGGRRLVSSAGGIQPRWTKGGREIVYPSAAGMMSVAVNPATGEIGTPVRLFGTADVHMDRDGRTFSYDVTPSGDRFLVMRRIERADALPLVVTLNWKPDMSGTSGGRK